MSPEPRGFSPPVCGDGVRLICLSSWNALGYSDPCSDQHQTPDGQDLRPTWPDTIGVWGMFVCAVPFGLIPWTQNYWILLLLAMCFGLGEAMVTSSAAALVVDFCKEAHLGSAMGAFDTLFDVGHAAGPLLVGFFIGLSGDQDFRMAFAAIALLVVLAAVLVRTGVKEGGAMPQNALKEEHHDTDRR